MKCCNTRCLRLASLLIAAVACGCVSQGTYEDVAAERDQLRKDKSQLDEQVKKLEDSSASLEAERLALIDELEDVRVASESSAQEAQRLKRSEAKLRDDLSAREAELASREAGLEELRGTYEGLVSDLESEVAAGQVQIEQLREGLRLNLAQEILFPSGSAQLNDAGIAVLRKVAERLRSLPNHVEVQGHTDNVALRANASYPSNWELAAARAARVVRLFVECGVKPERLTAVSFGEYAPVASNATPEGRAKNRRIEIRLQPVPETASSEAEPPGKP